MATKQDFKFLADWTTSTPVSDALVNVVGVQIHEDFGEGPQGRYDGIARFRPPLSPHFASEHFSGWADSPQGSIKLMFSIAVNEHGGIVGVTKGTLTGSSSTEEDLGEVIHPGPPILQFRAGRYVFYMTPMTTWTLQDAVLI